MIEKIKNGDGKFHTYARMFYFYILVIVLVVTNGFHIIFGYADFTIFKTKTTEKITMIDSRLIFLEDSERNSREILAEIKYNLKNYMLQTGFKYIEDTDRKK